jgi:hypothetical protein
LKTPILLLAAALCGAPLARANAVASALAPDYLDLQFAGYTGWLTVGAGYSFAEGRVETEVMYGYVPNFVSRVPVHTFAQKTTLAPIRLPVGRSLVFYPLHAGYTASFVPGDAFFLFIPDRYPRKDYYWPTSLHLALFVGGKIRHSFSSPGYLRAAALYAQAGTLTHYLKSLTHNEVVQLDDVISLTLGLQAYF